MPPVRFHDECLPAAIQVAKLHDEGNFVSVIEFRYVATVSPAPLLARFGEHQRIVDIEERFACTECGNHTGNSFAVCRLNRNA